MQKYITEFIGTFFLVFLIGNVVIDPGAVAAEQLAPLAIGTGLMVLVYAGGHISGAHYNPAVTIALLLRGRCEKHDVLPYIGVQVAAATSAAFTVAFLKGTQAMTAVKAADLDLPRAMTAEVLGTFLLVWVILNVATAKGTEGNPFYGAAIGFTVCALAYALGHYSGAVFNPAVAVGVCTMGLAGWTDLWMYLVASVGGGVLAALVFRIVNPDESAE